MRINTKIRYGIRTMIEIAMNNETGTLQKTIAKNQSISEKYLDHIIAALKVSGLIKNVKGKKSGYKLTKDPFDIPVSHIFRAFEPSFAVTECVIDHRSCDRFQQCASRMFWEKMNNMMVEFLYNTSLGELVEDQEKLNRVNQDSDMYYI